MSLPVEFNEIVGALRQAGVLEGDLVNVHSRLFTLGLVQGVTSTSDIPAFYLRALREVLGDGGTLVVPTYTTSFGRIGKPFDLEGSPSEMGIFSEYVRKAEGSRRTLHPIQSLTAVGALAQELTWDHPCWNVGHDTIWDRMLKRQGKVVVMGIPPRQCLSFVHHVEFLACAPYIYHKVLQGEVYAGGIRILHPFLMAVRYLNCGIFYDLSRLQADLICLSAMKQVPLGGDFVWVVSLEAVFETCMKGLRKDPYYLLQKAPSFVQGEIPLDGPTSGREGFIPSYFEISR